MLSVMDCGYLTESRGLLSEPKGSGKVKPKLKEYFPEKLWPSEVHKKYHSGAQLTRSHFNSRTRI